MIKVAIVEDDMACANELKSFLSRYKIDAGCAMEAEYFSTADEFLKSFNAGDYEMIFLDIEMPGTNGMQAAKLIREKDSEVLLFFVTNLSQYALESYEVQAFNFMVKPITYDNFVLKIERAVKMVSRSRCRQRQIRRKSFYGVGTKIRGSIQSSNRLPHDAWELFRARQLDESGMREV